MQRGEIGRLYAGILGDQRLHGGRGRREGGIEREKKDRIGGCRMESMRNREKKRYRAREKEGGKRRAGGNGRRTESVRDVALAVLAGK